VADFTPRDLLLEPKLEAAPKVTNQTAKTTIEDEQNQQIQAKALE
jgi:hypothetical protein